MSPLDSNCLHTLLLGVYDMSCVGCESLHPCLLGVDGGTPFVSEGSGVDGGFSLDGEALRTRLLGVDGVSPFG